MTKWNFEAIKKFVSDNNKSTLVSNQLVVCLIWKESSFDDAVKNSGTTALGFMQITKGAVDDVNKNTPKGVHFEYNEMTDPEKNIACGTYYLDIRIKRSGGKIAKGIDRFGTGSGYAENILSCEKCMKQVANTPSSPNNTADDGGSDETTTDGSSGSPGEQSCLHKIHG